MTEAWRPVPGYEGRYEVSDEGRVQSAGFVVPTKNAWPAFRPGRVLAQATKTNGYRQVTLVTAPPEPVASEQPWDDGPPPMTA